MRKDLSTFYKSIPALAIVLTTMFTAVPVMANGFSFEVPYKVHKLPDYINGIKVDCRVFDKKKKRELARESSMVRIGETRNTIEAGTISMMFLVSPSKQKFMKKPMHYECKMWLCRGNLCMTPRPNSWASVSGKSYWRDTGTLPPLKKK